MRELNFNFVEISNGNEMEAVMSEDAGFGRGKTFGHARGQAAVPVSSREFIEVQDQN